MPTTAPTEVQRIATLVKNLRTERGWRQRELAEAANVSDRTIHAVESGAYRAHDSTYGRIARALDVPLTQLIGGE